MNDHFIFSEEAQKKISDMAFKEFIHYWKNPYKHKSDQQWVAAFRIFSATSKDKMTSDLEWPKFLRDYQVARGFPRAARGNLSDCFFRQASSSPNDAPSLAAAWKKADASRGTQLSAASKALFFARPNDCCVIFDSFACLAVGRRSGIGNAVKAEDFWSFHRKVLSIGNKLHQVWKEEIDNRKLVFDDVPIEFIYRRITDKHLFFEGKLFAALENCFVGLSEMKDLGFLQDAKSELKKDFGEFQ